MLHPEMPLLNIDTLFSPLASSDVTADVIEARVSMLAFKNLDSVEKRVDFVLDLVTREPRYWKQLASACSEAIYLLRERDWLLVFPATIECGYIKTYRFRPEHAAVTPKQYGCNVRNIQDADTLYRELNTQAARCVFEAWLKAKTKATELPTELVAGRLENTSVEKAVILSRGEGCVMCGGVAQCYAATTLGSLQQALMVQLPVCRNHLDEAKSYPNIFAFIVALFHLGIDIEGFEKATNIPDSLIPAIHAAISDALLGRTCGAEKRERGWHLWIELETGWRWLLRIGSLTDYAYMLYEPGVKKERYRADSAPDHPDLKFFPIHQHSAPGRKRDEVSPSFLYGLPIFDVKRLRTVAHELGAYPSAQ